jgi:hypothetical protein
MRIRLLAFFLTVVLLPLSFGLAQTASGLDSIPARMHDAIVAKEVPGVGHGCRNARLCASNGRSGLG